MMVGAAGEQQKRSLYKCHYAIKDAAEVGVHSALAHSMVKSLQRFDPFDCLNGFNSLVRCFVAQTLVGVFHRMDMIQTNCFKSRVIRWNWLCFLPTLVQQRR